MRLSGWLRLWIVGAVLYGAIVALHAYRERPTLEQLQYNWNRDASDKIAAAISRAESPGLSAEKISAHWFDGRAEADVISELESIERSPSANQKLFSSEIAKVNATHRKIISELGTLRLESILQALLWWLGPCLSLLVLGWSIGWVVSGFRVERADR